MYIREIETEAMHCFCRMSRMISVFMARNNGFEQQSGDELLKPVDDFINGHKNTTDGSRRCLYAYNCISKYVTRYY